MNNTVYVYWCDEHFDPSKPEFTVAPFPGIAVCWCGKDATHWYVVEDKVKDE